MPETAEKSMQIEQNIAIEAEQDQKIEEIRKELDSNTTQIQETDPS